MSVSYNLSVLNKLTVIGDTLIKGDLSVTGSTTSISVENLNIDDNAIYLNNGNISGSLGGGIILNYSSGAKSDTVSIVSGFINTTTVVTTGSDTFASGDIIQISVDKNTNEYLGNKYNLGVFVVDSHIGSNLIIDTSMGVSDYFQTSFQEETSIIGTIYIVSIQVSSIYSNTSGVWFALKGDTYATFIASSKKLLTDGTSATSISALNTSGAAFNTVQDIANFAQSAGFISGGYITDNNDGTVSVDAGNGILRNDAYPGTPCYFISWAANTSLSLFNNNLNYVGVSWNGGNPIVVSSTTEQNGFDEFTLATIYKSDTTIYIINGSLRPSVDYVNLFMKRLNAANFIQHVSGAVVTDIGTRNIFISTGLFYIGIIAYNFMPFDSSASDTFTYYYNNESYVTINAQTSIDNTQYDDGGVLTSLNDDEYGVHWIYILMSNSSVHVIYGEASYTLTAAHNTASPRSILPGHFTKNAVLVAKIIIQKNASTFTSITSAFSTTFTSSANQVNVVTETGNDNAIVRFDANGNSLQNSSITIDDNGGINTSGSINFAENASPPSGAASTARLYASSSSLLFVKQNGDLIDLASSGGVPVFVGATSITDGSSGIVPAPVQGQENYYLKGDGTWAEGGSGTSTVFTGATDISDGSSGIVPAPVQGQQDFYLKGDGTWQSTVVTVSNAANGSQTAPSYSFSSDTNTGMYRSNIDELAFTTGGIQRISIKSTGTTVGTRMLIYAGSNEIPGYSFSTDSDTGMHLNGADTLAFSTGGLLRTTISSWGIWNNGYIQNRPGGSDGSAPSYTFITNTNTGMFSPALNKIGFSCAGVKIAEIDSTGIRIAADAYRITNAIGSVTAPSYTFINDGNTGMYSPYPDQLGFSTGAVSRMSINNTGVVDISNRITIAAGSASAPSYSFKEQPSSGMYRAGSAIRFSSGGVYSLDISSSALLPGGDNTFTLGNSSARWNTVYAGSGTINTSDSTQKIITGDVPSLNFIMKLKPVMYKFVDIPDVVENGVVKVPGVKHTRNHYGFMAQDIENLINSGDITDSGLFVKGMIDVDNKPINMKDVNLDTKIKGSYYGLRYDELIAPLVKAIQELCIKVEILEHKLNNIK